MNHRESAWILLDELHRIGTGECTPTSIQLEAHILRVCVLHQHVIDALAAFLAIYPAELLRVIVEHSLDAILGTNLARFVHRVARFHDGIVRAIAKIWTYVTMMYLHLLRPCKVGFSSQIVRGYGLQVQAFDIGLILLSTHASCEGAHQFHTIETDFRKLLQHLYAS